MGTAVELHGLSKSFGNVPVLRDVSLSVKPGEFLTLLGPSGCGKSTLLRIIAGLEFQDAGEVQLDGRAVDNLAPKLRNVAMVFQSYALYPHMTVAGNIGLPLTMTRLTPAQRFPFLGRLLPGARAERARIAAEVQAVARALEIESLLGRRPSQLSGGQKQRVAVARAMVRHPSVFLMDEPLSNLDANLRLHMRGELTELHRRLGATLIYVTHDQTEAMTMSDRVAVMQHGRILQIGTPREIYANPDSLEVAEFIGSPKINIFPARAAAGVIEVCGATLPIPHDLVPGTELRLGVRAEAIALAQRGAPGTIAVTVRQVEHLGPEALVHAALSDSARPIVLRVDAAIGATLHAEQSLSVQFRPETTLIFDAQNRRLRLSPESKRMAVAHG